MLLWLGLILNYRQHNKNIRMCKILDILNFRNLKTFRRLVLPQRLHSHLVKFENHQWLTKSIDHHTYVIFAYLLFTPQYWQFFPKILHNRILKDLLKFILILVVQSVGFVDLLLLFWVNLFDDSIVLFQVNVELGWSWAFFRVYVFSLFRKVVIFLENVKCCFNDTLDCTVLVQLFFGLCQRGFIVGLQLHHVITSGRF